MCRHANHAAGDGPWPRERRPGLPGNPPNPPPPQRRRRAAKSKATQVAPVPGNAPAPGVRCPVVGVGASAGGFEAFREFLTALPRDTGFAFVLVQHLDPGHESMLTRLLSKATAMTVSEVNEGMAVEAEPCLRDPAEHDDEHQGRAAAPGGGAEVDAAAPADRPLPALAGRGFRQSGDRGHPLRDGVRRHPGAQGHQGRGRHHLRAGQQSRPSTTACRAAPSPPAAWTSSCRRTRSPASWRESAGIRISEPRRPPNRRRAARRRRRGAAQDLLAC